MKLQVGSVCNHLKLVILPYSVLQLHTNPVKVSEILFLPKIP